MKVDPLVRIGQGVREQMKLLGPAHEFYPVRLRSIHPYVSTNVQNLCQGDKNLQKQSISTNSSRGIPQSQVVRGMNSHFESFIAKSFQFLDWESQER